MVQHRGEITLAGDTPELLLVDAVRNALAQLVIHHQHFENADTAAVAGIEAVIAALAAVVLAPRARRQLGELQRRLVRGILGPAAVADTAHQALGNDAAHTGGDQIGRHAHVDQTGDGRNSVLGM